MVQRVGRHVSAELVRIHPAISPHLLHRNIHSDGQGELPRHGAIGAQVRSQARGGATHYRKRPELHDEIAGLSSMYVCMYVFNHANKILSLYMYVCMYVCFHV
jgi:hypothetical protein